MSSNNILDFEINPETFRDEARIESFSEYKHKYWVERKRFQFSYAAEQIRKKPA